MLEERCWESVKTTLFVGQARINFKTSSTVAGVKTLNSEGAAEGEG